MQLRRGISFYIRNIRRRIISSYLYYNYGTPTNPRTSSVVRSRNSSPSIFLNTSNNNSGNSGHGSPASQNLCPRAQGVNIMDGNDIKLLIFNGNGLENQEKIWFLCEVVWTMQQVEGDAIKKA